MKATNLTVHNNGRQNMRPDLQGVSFNVLLANTCDKIAEKSFHMDKPLYTGFSSIDQVTDGLQKGQLMLIGARPGVGKSTLALQLALNLLRQSQAKICMYLLEETRERTGQRILCNTTRISISRLDKGVLTVEEGHEVNHAIIGLCLQSNDRMTLIHPSLLTPADIRRKLEYDRSQGRQLDVIIVDHLGLMRGDRSTYDTSHAEISDISWQLKRMTLDYGVSIVACAQLNRALTDRADKRPTLSDLRGSGSLEQDADTVLLLHRDNYFNHSQETNRDVYLDVYIEKNRYGRTGMVRLHWDPEHATVSD